ncbi:hypothetical protein [Idiomarina xiamenensis]|uniref:Nitroreductase domain-containing protein n=1 Tax=Idiomarina xiamenensis 10-D-4 TaxID=740709 RepID=K2KYA8_9GAMM|nr:hypothetical protein [Idiomarina xiamenensis]EKE87554.1 hypothetical protein A10D4_00630 [Idiomarina xiamenensis 10-D-4]
MLFQFCAAPARYEPLNRPDIHYPVSSFGGLLSCCFYLLTPTARQGYVDVFRYQPNYHALECVARQQAWQQPLAADQALLAIAGNYWMVVNKYGEYSPYGVALDAGILVAQANYLTQLCELHSSACPESLPALQALLVDNQSATQIFAAQTLRFQQPPWQLLQSNAADTRIAVWQEPSIAYASLPNLPALFNLFATPAPTPEPSSSAPSGSAPVTLPTTDVLRVMQRRTAANDAVGFAQKTPPLSRQFLTDFLQTREQLAQRRERLAGESLLTMQVAWINPFGVEQGLYDGQGQALRLPADKEAFLDQLRDCLYSSQQKYNIASLTMELFITVEPQQWLAAYGDSSLRLAHMAAGAVAHDIALTASLFGAFARPVRMFRDTALQQRLGLTGQLLVQVLVGFHRHHNFAVKL